MNNLKTTITGVIAALSIVGKNIWPEGGPIFDAVMALAIALLAYFAADKVKP